MARKSRKVNNIKDEKDISVRYSVAVYVRLSLVDNGKKNDSLEVQKETILEYVDNNIDMELYKIYSDNGATGTNFERDGFEQMMDDIRNKRVNCVIVRDLSRFGRNYIETGNYIEKIFPFLGVRFISVKDNFDSFSSEKSEDGYIIPLKNLIHDVYAKDISRKVGVAERVLQEKGVFVGSIPPYGYNRSKEDSHKLEIDEVVAPVVKRIFQMRADGESLTTIARILRSENILAPSKYRYECGLLRHSKFKDVQWGDATIKAILGNETYTGDMVGGKTISCFYKGRGKKKQPKANHIRVKNTHEAIISKELFDKVEQMRIKNLETYNKGRENGKDLETQINMLQGLVYCGKCNKVLSKRRTHSKERPQATPYHYYYCRRAMKKEDDCEFKMVKTDKVLEVVLKVIQKDIKTITNLKQKLSHLEKRGEFKNLKANKTKELKKTNEALEMAKKYRKSLFERYIDNKIKENDFLNMTEIYNTEIENLNRKINKISDSDNFNLENVNKSKWIKRFEEFSNSEEITPELIKSLVDKVIIKDKKEMEVILKYRDEFKELKLFIKQQEVSLDEKV